VKLTASKDPAILASVLAGCGEGLQPALQRLADAPFDVVHGHDWLVAGAADHLAKRFRCPLVVTIHATEYGRHQGWVDKHPQSHIHAVEQWMARTADRVITCSHYMRGHVAEIFGVDLDGSLRHASFSASVAELSRQRDEWKYRPRGGLTWRAKWGSLARPSGSRGSSRAPRPDLPRSWP